MYIIVAGVGVLGFYTAQFLTKKGNDVVAVELRKERAEEITDRLDATIICGDAKEIKVLQEAGVEQADVILAMTGSDDTNILISLLAKQLGVKRTLCRITHIDYSETLFKKLGVDAVVYPELTIATEIEEMVNDPDVSGFAMLDNGETEMVEFNITSDSKLVGKRINKVKLPKSSQILSIIRSNGEKEAAFPESPINQGDKILVLTNKGEIHKVEEVFSG
jgi:trk system potassium uptake protein TrkA